MKSIHYEKKEMDKTAYITMFLGRTLRALEPTITNISIRETPELKQLLLIERTDGQTVVDITNLNNLEITQEAIKFIE